MAIYIYIVGIAIIFFGAFLDNEKARTTILIIGAVSVSLAFAFSYADFIELVRWISQ